jgi:hypothetical protein
MKTQQWRVHGYALMPVGAVAYVDAATEEEALEKAQALWRADKRSLLIPGSEDLGAAADWEPSADPETVECEECEGNGQRAFAVNCGEYTPCVDCNGTGRVPCENASHQAPAALDAANTTDATSRLPACAGSPSNDKPSTKNQ